MSHERPNSPTPKPKTTVGHDETTAFDPSTSASWHDGTPSTSSAATENIPESFGRYRIERLLGRGGMGSVYLARDTQLERAVALKIPKLASDASGKLVPRFMREARAVALLSHPNICPVYDVGEQNGVPFLAMAYIPGKSLAQYLDTGKPQPERGVALTVYKIALGLDEAHAKGVLHRDLKPANVLVDSRGEPIVMDFGLAQRLDDEQQSRLTQEGTVVGTPAYMAPEQIDGRSQVGPATDVYSLGVLMYELLTGRCPFQGTMVSVIGQVLHTDPPLSSEVRRDISPALAQICAKAMAKDPAARFATMKELATALAGFIKGKTPPTVAIEPKVAQRPVVSPLDELFSAEQLSAGPALGTLHLRAKQGNSLPVGLLVAGGGGVALLLVGLLAYAMWPSGPPLPPIAEALKPPILENAPAPPTLPEIPKPDKLVPAPVELPKLPMPEPPALVPETEPTKNETEDPVVPTEPETSTPPEPTTPEPAPPQPTPSEQPEFPPRPEPPAGLPGPQTPIDWGKLASVEDLFARADHNKDGQLDPTEVPLHLILRGDKNNDRQLDLKEAKQAFTRLKQRLFAPPSPAEMRRLPRGPGGPRPPGNPFP